MDKQIVRNICGKEEEGKIIYEVKTEKEKTQEMIRIGAKKKDTEGFERKKRKGKNEG